MGHGCEGIGIASNRRWTIQRSGCLSTERRSLAHVSRSIDSRMYTSSPVFENAAFNTHESPAFQLPSPGSQHSVSSTFHVFILLDKVSQVSGNLLLSVRRATAGFETRVRPPKKSHFHPQLHGNFASHSP